ncbi:MAG: Type 1 glutamine amidotransferase-like domain-containing protein [Gordonia sp. (in: high G+C Gram-positive bacteria)]|uniref:Type 1 glutamine amidotransferase-like domain-containing protein n=1 Tax=Gordonia sp. (in: high G+C Gram-positive bacteria) TaxID=84139 RepID=UPI0039E3A9F7
MNLLLLSWGAGALPEFLAKHTGKAPADVRLGFLNDAVLPFSEEEFASIEPYRLRDLGYRPTTITARDVPTAAEFARVLDSLDALYVCGGETFVLMDHLRRNGLADVLVAKVRDGLPYVGLSAGAVIAGASIEPVSLMDDPTTAPELTDHRGLGFVATSIVPHADGKIEIFPPELIDRVRETYADRFDLVFLPDDRALLVSDDEVALIASP